MGAPLLTDEVQETLCELLRRGNPLTVALGVAGVSRPTFYRWLDRGRSPDPEDEPYRAFRSAIEAARAQAEAVLVAHTGRHAARNWRAAAAILEARWPERWGPPSARQPRPVRR